MVRQLAFYFIIDKSRDFLIKPSKSNRQKNCHQFPRAKSEIFKLLLLYKTKTHLLFYK